MSADSNQPPSLRHKASSFFSSFRAKPSVSNLSALFKKDGNKSRLTIDEYGRKKYGEKSYGWVCCKCTTCNLLWQRPGMRCQGPNCPDGRPSPPHSPLTGRAVEPVGHMTWTYGEDRPCRQCRKVEIYRGGEEHLRKAGQQNPETGWVHNQEGCMQWHGNMWGQNFCGGRGCQQTDEHRLYTVTIANDNR